LQERNSEQEKTTTMNARELPAIDTTPSTWPAELRLRIEQRANVGARLVECTHSGPLRIQRPFYPEGPDCAHLYILHPPGGLVSGDDLLIRVDVAENSSALLTTPGAGRIYRARKSTFEQRSKQTQRIHLTVNKNATLEWLPQATIVFDGADVVLDLNVNLDGDSAFLGWETVCLGRPAGQLPFERGYIEQRWRVMRDGVPLLNDRLSIHGDDHLRDATWGLQQLPVYGTFLAVPRAQQPISASAIESLRALFAEQQAEAEIAVTALRGMAIVRYLGDSTERAHELFEMSWRLFRPFINGRIATRPRIWNT